VSAADTPCVDRDDAGSGTPANGPSASGFQFNLDAALTELRRSRPPTLADLMRVGDDGSAGALTGGARDAADAVGDASPETVPDIHEATSVDHPPRPATPLVTSWTASTQPSAAAASPAAGVTGAVTAGVSSSGAGGGGVGVLDAPSLPAHATATMPSIPTVPTAPAYVPPPPAPSPFVGTTPTPSRAANAGSRGKRKKRRAGVKAFLVLLILGGVVAGALVYGRSYLFPDEWDRDLVPIADDIEATVGVEFVDAVRVDELPAEEYDTRAAAAVFGTGWEAQLPVWRALGLAAGEATPTAFGPVLRSWSPGVYDPATGEVVLIEKLGGRARDAALTELLTAVLLDQVYEANLLVDSANPLVSRAVVAHQVELTADASTTAIEPVLDRTQLDTMPSPLAYELLARADLGAPAAAAGGLTLAADDASDLAQLPGAVSDVLGAAPASAAPARLGTGDIATADSTVPTRDLWYLVFGAYLPADAAAAGAQAISAGSLTSATRGELTCAYATLSAADAAGAGVLQFVVNAWAQSAPVESAATVTTFEDGTVQLAACDPGAAPAVLPRPGVAAELVARQVALLAG
jgi:hypothetical protein